MRGDSRLRKKNGMWVINTGKPLTPEIDEKTRKKILAERDRRIWGKRKKAERH